MRRNQRFGIAAVMAGALAVSAVAATGASAHRATTASSSLAGTTINVAIAYPAPKADLAKFTKQTGIKVNWDYVQWDALQTKIAAAAEAHSYFADVADVDWSKVGEYYATKWFMPLNKYFPLSSVRAQYPQAPAFIRNGELLGHADGRVAAGHDRQHRRTSRRPGSRRTRRRSPSTRPTSRRSQRRPRPRTRWTSRSPRPRASRPTGMR